ncbi:hypothetical protein RRG08_063264 [Elysia crispata]|uniref:Uncharacterized protein n=1 Tax=Elysia crispata TaxID=231223 RepID=A0AAE0XPT6_9GAST|nr:hypothetical protein RRG08_063264 [Elysia crispata]
MGRKLKVGRTKEGDFYTNISENLMLRTRLMKKTSGSRDKAWSQSPQMCHPKSRESQGQPVRTDTALSFDQIANESDIQEWILQLEDMPAGKRAGGGLPQILAAHRFCRDEALRVKEHNKCKILGPLFDNFGGQRL